MKKIFTLIVLSLLITTASFALVPANDLPDQVKVIQLYPNPATSNITFEFSQDIDRTYTLQVYSLMGKKVSEVVIDGTKVILQLDGYFRGLYIYQLRDKNGQIIESGRFQVAK